MSKRAKTAKPDNLDDQETPKVVFAQIVDSDELNEPDVDNPSEDDSFIKDIPVKRKRKLAEPNTTLLTRHLQLIKEF